MKTTISQLPRCPLSRPTRFRRQPQPETGFTRLDLFIVIATSLLVAGLVLPLMASTRPRSEQAICANNLRQIGQAVRSWGAEHDNKPHWLVDRKDGGYRPDGADSGVRVPGNVFEIFAFIRNELGTPRILACPSDTKRVVNDFNRLIQPGFRNNCVSYFVALHAFPEEPSSWVSGDRNLRVNGWMGGCAAAGFNNANVSALPDPLLGWTNSVHRQSGNLLLTSGAVLQLSNQGLSNALNLNTNSLIFPREGYPYLHFLIP